MPYFLLTVTQDSVYLEVIKPNELLEDLAREPEEMDQDDILPFTDKMPDDMDVENWRPLRLLIRGDIVKPKPVEVVTKFSLE